MRLIAIFSLCLTLLSFTQTHHAQAKPKKDKTQQEFWDAVQLYSTDSVKAKAKIDALFKEGKTPKLQSLVWSVRSSGGDNGLTYMLDHHTNKISKKYASEALFDTAIEQPLLDKLIKGGADVNYFHPEFHYTPIQRASTWSRLSDSKALLAAGAIPKAFYRGKWMPISLYLKIRLADAKKNAAILSKLPKPTRQDEADLESAQRLSKNLPQSIAFFEEAEKTFDSAALTKQPSAKVRPTK